MLPISAANLVRRSYGELYAGFSKVGVLSASLSSYELDKVDL